MFQKAIARYANILHIRFTDTFAGLPKNALNAISPNNVLLRFLFVLLYTGARLIGNLFLPLKQPTTMQGKIWLYVVSRNNYDSLSFLKHSLPDAVFVAGQNKDVGVYKELVNRISARFKIFYYYQFFPVWWGLYRLKGKRALRFFDLIFVAIGYYEISRAALKKYQPSCLIFSNDHNTDARAMLLAARDLQIPTIYIQHASVSTSFPPLEFDLSLLEGQDSLDKYQKCGPITGQVKLIGMPKADKYLGNKNVSTTILKIGICANIIDETEAIKNLIFGISREFPDKIISFRPHPGDKRNFSFVHQINRTIIFSDAKVEPVFEFLKNQDCIIAADSSIHLEAVMLNIVSIYYRMEHSKFIYDYYGYVKNNLVEQATSLKATVSIIKKYSVNKPDLSGRARYYNAVIGTEYEGRSHELAIKYIQTFLDSRK